MNINTHACLVSALIAVTLFFSEPLFGQEHGERRDDPAAREAYEFQMLQSPHSGALPANIRARELAFSATLPVRNKSMKKGENSLGIQSQEWMSRGPLNIGGRTRALAMDVKNESNLLAAGVSGGMWRSIDAGQSWVRITPLDQFPSATCIAQDIRSGKTNTWYYGTGERFGNSPSVKRGVGVYYGDGIFKSTDNGLTWAQLPGSASYTPQTLNPMDYIWRIAVDPSKSGQDIVYAAALGGIYRSTNGGTSWQLVLGTTDMNRASVATDIAVTSHGVLYATLSDTTITTERSKVSGIYRSVDGVQWANITPPDLPVNFGRFVLAIAPSQETTVYFLGNTVSSGFSQDDDLAENRIYKYTYISGDGSGSGGKWENRSDNLPDFGKPFGKYVSQDGYSMAIRVHPTNPNIVSIGGTSVYLSTDGFATADYITWIGGYNPYYTGNWFSMMYPNHHPDVHDILFLPSNPQALMTATDGGVHLTTDAFADQVSWTPLNNGYITTQFYTIAINQAESGNQLLIGGLQDNNTYGSPEPDANWDWIAGGDGSFCAITDDNTTLYVSSQYGSLYHSELTPPFQTTYPSYCSYFSPLDTFLFVAPFALDPADNNIMYMPTHNQVMRNANLLAANSTDLWETVTGRQDVLNTISAVAVSTENPAHRLYCGTSRGKVFVVENAHFATEGEPVYDITGDNFPAGAYIKCIAVDPNNGDHIIVVFANYEVQSLFETKDAGAIWTNISGNLEEHPDGSGAGPSCRWAEIAHHNGQTLYLVGTSTGLYSTTKLNGDQTQWEQEGATSIGNVVVPMMRVRQSDGFVAVATHGNGVFTTSIVTDVEEGGASVQTFYLEESYPNPSGNSTTVRFALPKSSKAMLRLYDALGHVVRTLVDARMESGYHTVEIETKDLPSGRYFLHLESDSQTQTRLVTVVH